MLPTNVVLIVDDEEEILKLLDIELSSQGYRVIKANNGYDAFEKAKGLRPNIIVTDVLMPDLDGGQLIKLLKSHAATKDIPVIFITAALTKAEERSQHIGITVDHTSYSAIAKPFEVHELLAEIEKLLRKSVGH